jgi:hypothetical protein
MEKLKSNELADALKGRNMPYTGNKLERLQRLQDWMDANFPSAIIEEPTGGDDGGAATAAGGDGVDKLRFYPPCRGEARCRGRQPAV